MWGFKKKKEMSFVPTHLCLNCWPVVLTGLCTEDSIEVYGPFAGELTKRWERKAYIALIYNCPDYAEKH